MNFKSKINNTALVIILLICFLFISGCSGEKVSANAPENSSSNLSTQNIENNSASQNALSSQEKSASISKLNLKEAKISRVVDGDTVELSEGTKIRLIGVNSPESTTRTEPYGKEASNYTKSSLTGKTVYLEKDVSETDQYGRLLRYVWIDVPKEITDSEIKTKMFNAILVENGYAQVSTYPPDVKYRDYFTKYNMDARNAKKGLWTIDPNGTTKGDALSNSNNNLSSSSNKSNSTSSFSTSSKNEDSSINTSYPSSSNETKSSKGLIKGNINYKGEKIYHVPGGQFYDKTNAEQWFNTEQEAQAAGYRKSKR